MLQGLQVNGLVIGRRGFSATKEDANPFVGEGTGCGVVGSTLLQALLVVCFCPARLLAEGIGEFVKGLAQKFRARHPPMDPVHFAARLRRWGDAGELLQLLHILVAVAKRC